MSVRCGVWRAWSCSARSIPPRCTEPVASLVHWPIAPIRCRDRHTARWREVADALGLHLYRGEVSHVGMPYFCAGCSATCELGVDLPIADRGDREVKTIGSPL